MRIIQILRIIIANNLKRNKLEDGVVDQSIFEDVPRLRLVKQNGMSIPMVGLVKDSDRKNYWAKYERFLKNNEIPYDFYDIHSHDWLEKSTEFDLIVWRTASSASELDEARKKIFVLEKYMGKLCFPTFNMIMIYEDKVLQHYLMKLKGLSEIETYVSNSIEDALALSKKLGVPLVSKVNPGSGSSGVELVRSHKAARKLVKKVFSYNGRWTYWPYLRQKDYVLFQKLQRNDGYDLRIIVIGNYVFGYYRDTPKHEFRASGLGVVRKEDLPVRAMDIARLVASKFDLPTVAVDFLYDSIEDKFYIIEMSSFIRVDTAEQLHVNGVPGVYTYEDGKYKFEAGKFWIQELSLKVFIEKTFRKSYGGVENERNRVCD
ncbi:ATP-dependent carboxylate-amine ligase [Mesotoga prima]|uniref:ATP-grasp domain-containing protein n=1 Tax=Mesotoga prima TaxID=1184387 RepID=UPI002FE40E9E